MCVIIKMLPKQKMDFEAWENAVHNNEHGFGMVVRKPRKSKTDELVLVKHFDAKGLDPKFLYDEVEKHKNYERWIHLRYKTAGDVSEDNVQPFLVYEDDDGRQAYFMHNGTLSDYKPRTTVSWEYGMKVEHSDDPRSDSQIFAEDCLSKSIGSMWSQDIGRGDYTCDFFIGFVDDIWRKQGPATNRGVIISNYANSLRMAISDWTTFYNSEKDGDKYHEFLVSNDLYFDTLVRGTEFDRLEEEKKLKKAQENTKQIEHWKSTGARRAVQLSTVKPNENLTTSLPDLDLIFNDPDVFDSNQINSYFLSSISFEEWEAMFKNQSYGVGAYVCYRLSEEMWDMNQDNDQIRDRYDELRKKYDDLVIKNEKTTNALKSLEANNANAATVG